MSYNGWRKDCGSLDLAISCFFMAKTQSKARQSFTISHHLSYIDTTGGTHSMHIMIAWRDICEYEWPQVTIIVWHVLTFSRFPGPRWAGVEGDAAPGGGDHAPRHQAQPPARRAGQVQRQDQGGPHRDGGQPPEHRGHPGQEGDRPGGLHWQPADQDSGRGAHPPETRLAHN